MWLLKAGDPLIEVTTYAGLTVNVISYIVNTYALRGSNSAIFICFLSKGDKLLQERICSCRSKFFLLSVDTFLEGF